MGASGHCAGLVLAEPGHGAHTVAPAEVPQIQFIDIVVVEAEPGYIIKCQSTETLEDILILGFARPVCTWFIIPLAAFLRCLGVACGVQIIGFFGR